MSEKCNCGCMFNWLSGLFAAPAIMHIIKLIAKWDVTFQGETISAKLSWTVIIVSGLLSLICGYIGCKKSHGSDKPVSSCCS